LSSKKKGDQKKDGGEGKTLTKLPLLYSQSSGRKEAILKDAACCPSPLLRFKLPEHRQAYFLNQFQPCEFLGKM